jgi:hypothetical protein
MQTQNIALERYVPPQIQLGRRDDAAHVLFRDYETRGVLPLSKVGVSRYAADPQTEVLCCAFAVDDLPVKLWTPGDAIPVEFREASANPNWIGVAHNASFEMAVEELLLASRYDWPLIPLERQRCTFAMASALALPGKLEKLADVLELSRRKDVGGHRLMLAMSKPRRARKGEKADQVHWFDDRERLQRLHAYCMADIEVERELYAHLQPLSPSEQAVWCLDACINSRGFYLDQQLAIAAKKLAAAAAPEIDTELAEITGGAVTAVNQIARFKAWLQTHGCILDSLDKNSVAKLLKNELPPHVQRALELRQDGGQAAVKKIVALLDRVGSGGRVRGSFIYHKASTGRWAGTGPQPQNLKRPEIEDVEAAITAVATGDYNHVRNLYPRRVLSLLGDLGRSLICAAPGYVLIGADFGAIESRALAWVAAEEWKLDAYRRYDATRDPRDEPYCVLAARMLHLPEGSVTPGTRERAFGKTGDLACGWCIWRWTPKPDGSWQKPPYVAMQPNRHASTNDSTTWTEYGTALAAVQAGHADGLTYVLTADDPFAAIDLDYCRDGLGGVDIWAQLFLERARNTYSEVTPSATGCRIWGVANGEKLHRKFDLVIDGKPIVAELFRRTNKALTITGMKLDNSIREFTSIDSVLDWAVIWGERRKSAAAQADPAIVSFNGGGNNYSIDQIEEIVRTGPPEGVNRSDTFHMIVGHYLGCGWTVERILAHLEQYPHGIGERYLRERRLAKEIARSAGKYGATALPLSDNGGWSSSWEANAPQPETPESLSNGPDSAVEISPDSAEQHVPQEQISPDAAEEQVPQVPCQESPEVGDAEGISLPHGKEAKAAGRGTTNRSANGVYQDSDGLLRSAEVASQELLPSDLPEPDMAVLRLQRRPAPKLPLEIFGERWAQWIEDNAECSACPVDYVAAPLLAAASAVIGHARWPRAGETWAEPPRNMQRNVRLPGLTTADAIHAACKALIEAGWLCQPAGGTRFQQRGTVSYPVSPRLLEVLPR